MSDQQGALIRVSHKGTARRQGHGSIHLNPYKALGLRSPAWVTGMQGLIFPPRKGRGLEREKKQ